MGETHPLRSPPNPTAHRQLIVFFMLLIACCVSMPRRLHSPLPPGIQPQNRDRPVECQPPLVRDRPTLNGRVVPIFLFSGVLPQRQPVSYTHLTLPTKR